MNRMQGRPSEESASGGGGGVLEKRGGESGGGGLGGPYQKVNFQGRKKF